MRSAAAAVLLVATPALAGELPEGRAEELARLVLNDCGSCHGLTLAGGLGPDIRPQALSGRAPEAVAEVILDGRPGTAMPPWRPLLSEAEAAWIAGYLLEGAR